MTQPQPIFVPVAEEALDLEGVIAEIGPEFAQRAGDSDATDGFVSENFDELKRRRVFSALVPRELGGGGASHSEVCEFLRDLAKYCSSTALALSMHQHLLAVAVWKWRREGAGEPLLRRVAAEQTVLVSTGATDWVGSNGTLEKVDGGYRFDARKVFGSGSPAGDLLMTTGPYEDPEEGWVVLHFPVSFSAEGVSSAGDWVAHGMRGTGSHSVVLESVFVPEESVALRRPRGEWHPVWNAVLIAALPLIMSVYRGIAEKAAETARGRASKKSSDPHLPYLLGEMENALMTTRLAVDAMIATAEDLGFDPTLENANAGLIQKTLATRAAKETVEKAMEACGGIGFYRGFGLEKLLRDVHAAPYHPLPEKKQLLFSGRVAMGRDPIHGSLEE